MNDSSKLKLAIDTLITIDEADGLDHNRIVGEVFEDIRTNPGYYAEYSYYSDKFSTVVPRPTDIITNLSGSVLIQGSRTVVRSFFKKSYFSYKVEMSHPVPVSFSQERSQVFYTLLDSLYLYKKEKDIKERVATFRREKENRNNNIRDNYLTINGGGVNSIVLNSGNYMGSLIPSPAAGDMRMTLDGKQEFYDGTAWRKTTL